MARFQKGPVPPPPPTLEDPLVCDDVQFDSLLSRLDTRGLVSLIRTIQSRMVSEQTAFEALGGQLQEVTNDLQRQELSVQLCARQAHLAQLCARNLRCFLQHQKQQQQQQHKPPLAPTTTAAAAPRPRPAGQEPHLAVESGGRNNEGFYSLPRRRPLFRPPSWDSLNNRDDSDLPVRSSVDHEVQERSRRLLRSWSALDVQVVPDDEDDCWGLGRGQLARAPSVEEILASVKALRQRRPQQEMGILGKEEPCYANVGIVRGAADGAEERHYENVIRKDTVVHKETVYENVRVPVTYDVPKSAVHVYDTPKSSKTSSLIPTAARLVMRSVIKTNRHEDEECEADSLEGAASMVPDIPSPDYGSEEEEDLLEEEEEEASDEGLGESDERSFYTEDPGLEVILEEPEEEEGGSTTKDSLAVATTPIIAVNGASTSTSPTASEGVWSADGADVDDVSGRRASDAGQQTDRCVEVYQETLRQRGMKNSSSSSSNNSDVKAVRASSTSEQLPSVRALRSRFEHRHDGTDAAPRMAVRPSQPPPPPPTATATDVVNHLSSDGLNHKVTNGDHHHAHGDLLDGAPTPRICTRRWDPTKLLSMLYHVPEVKVGSNPDVSSTYVNMEGYLDVLPAGRKKATYWNAWKRRYVRARDGVLRAYDSAADAMAADESEDAEEPPVSMWLSGGNVDVSEATTLTNGDGGMVGRDRQPLMSCILGVDDGRGRYLTLRTPSRQECERWRRALLTHTVEKCDAHLVRPWPLPREPELFRPAVIIELGSSSIRAGRLCTQPVLPQLFFPSVVAVERETSKIHYGASALLPHIRSSSTLHYPLRPSEKISKFALETSHLHGLFTHIIQSLNVHQPSEMGVLLVLPRRFPNATLSLLAAILLEELGCRWLAVCRQSVLVLYAYGATTGVVVDIGERTDVISVSEGYQTYGSDTRMPCGGRVLQEQLRPALAQRQRVGITGEMEALLLRLAAESLCYVARDYKDELRTAAEEPGFCEGSVQLREFFSEEECPWDLEEIPDELTLDTGRFQAPEGLFQPSLWGLDQPGLHRLVHSAIQESGLDLRREMARSVFLSGGLSLIPGLAERLQDELTLLLPPAVSPRVHASPFRYHAAFLGATQLANQTQFRQIQVSRNEWKSNSNNAIARWNL